jgi:hypothetical protein
VSVYIFVAVCDGEEFPDVRLFVALEFQLWFVALVGF